MKTTIYHVRVKGQSVHSHWVAWFLEDPTLTQIESALLIDIEALQANVAEDEEDEGVDEEAELAEDYCVLLQVVRHAIATDHKGSDKIEAAGCWIGAIEITEESAFTQLPT